MALVKQILHVVSDAVDTRSDSWAAGSTRDGSPVATGTKAGTAVAVGVLLPLPSTRAAHDVLGRL